MVNPLLSAGQAAATLLQQHDDEQRAYLEAVSRMHGSTVANMLSGKTLDDHKADALRYRLEPWLNQVWETVTPQPPRHDPRRDVHHHTPRHSPGISI